MSSETQKLTRWKLLDSLLAQGRPLTQNDIFRALQEEFRLIAPSRLAGADDSGRLLMLRETYQPTLRKDLTIFKKALKDNNLSHMLIENSGAEDKCVGTGKDQRTRSYRYAEPGFSMLPLLTNEMSDSEYNLLLKTLDKISGRFSDRIYGQLRFAMMSRVEADYDKGMMAVDYEDNRRLKGREYRPMIYDAILNRKILRIHYTKFDGEEFCYTFHPYLLKQYNERWFAFGRCPEEGNNPYWNFPLDRLSCPPSVIGTYEEARPDNYCDYFSDIIGVTKYAGKKPVLITIEISDLNAWGRVTTKPLPTQTIISEYDTQKESGTITLCVVPNAELYSKLLSLGQNVRVLSPTSIVKEMTKRLKAMLRGYEVD